MKAQSGNGKIQTACKLKNDVRVNAKCNKCPIWTLEFVPQI